MSIQDHVDEHEPSISAYLGVFVALLALTAITVGVAFLDLGIFNNLVALGIAVVKAMLVIAIFMHLKDSARILWIVAFAGFMWLAVLLALSMSDLVSRGWVPQPESWL